jgi:hypothetical protein
LIAVDAMDTALLQRSPERALMTNVIVYSFKGYDTAKHRYILHPAEAALERIRMIDDAVAIAGVGRRVAALVDG